MPLSELMLIRWGISEATMAESRGGRRIRRNACGCMRGGGRERAEREGGGGEVWGEGEGEGQGGGSGGQGRGQGRIREG